MPLAAREIPATAGTLEPLALRQLAPRADLAMDDTAPIHLDARAAPKVKHGQPGMDDGAIAGLVVGVIAAVGLLVFCFYPFVVRQIKRRRNADRPPFDTEAAMVVAPGAPMAAVVPTRQLSSSDSYKDTQTSRAGPKGRHSKDLGWSQDGSQYAGGDGQSQHPSSVGPDAGALDQGRSSITAPRPAAFPHFDGEYYPISTHDDQPGVLKGTSADYYSPNIPSEAFGMITNPPSDSPVDVPNRPDRSLSRGSSLRYNVKQMFHRKSGRDRTMSSHASSDDPSSPSSGAPQPRAVTPMERIITDEDPTASPTDVSPTTTTMPRAVAQQEYQSPPIIRAPTRSPPPVLAKTPPLSSPSHFNGSPSPPTRPAPGTVNPMDIMPASTASEIWHHTEHQLFVSSFDPSPSHPGSTEPPEIEVDPIVPSPSPHSDTTPYPTHRILSPTPTTTDPTLKQEPHEEEDVVMHDIPSHNHLSPMPMLAPGGRHPSYASEISTPLPGPASTVPSSQNTPSTQLDSPSPQSMGSSDFRQSASPQLGLNVPSPKNGVYRCEEPGCAQTFDQPHKLKYVLTLDQAK